MFRTTGKKKKECHLIKWAKSSSSGAPEALIRQLRIKRAPRPRVADRGDGKGERS